MVMVNGAVLALNSMGLRPFFLPSIAPKCSVKLLINSSVNDSATFSFAQGVTFFR